MSLYSKVLAERMKLPRHLVEGEAVIIKYPKMATRFLCPNAFLEEQDIKMASAVFWHVDSKVTCFTIISNGSSIREESHDFTN